MTRHTRTAGLVARHLRARAGGGAIVALLVLLLSFLATAAPLALGLLGDATIRDRLDDLAPTQTDVVSETLGLPEYEPTGLTPTTDEVWGTFLGELDGIRADADPPLPDLLGAPVAVSRSSASPLAEAPQTRALSVAFSPDVESRITLVDGRLPDASPTEPLNSGGPLRVEIVLSTETAAELQWTVGESRTTGALVEVVLTGLFEAADPDDAFWQHVTSVLEPNIFDDGNAPRSVTGTGFAHPASLPLAYYLGTRQSTDVWYPVDADAVTTDDAPAATAALRRLTAVSHPITADGGYGISSLSFDAPLTTEIDAALGQQAATLGVIAMLVAGPVGVAAAVLALGCRIILDARRPALRLASARGASTGQLRGLLGVEGAVTGLLPAAVGAATAVAIGMPVLGAVPTPLTFAPALLVGVAPIAVLAALAPLAAEQQVRTDLGRRGPRLRLIAEGVSAGLAAVALVLLLVRGYSDGVDLLLAATPLLLALVACLGTLRLYPLPLAAVFARARRGPSLDGFLGSARALREPSIGVTPVLALVVGVSVAVSSAVLLSTIQSGAAEASRARVGADMRIVGGLFFDGSLDQVRAVDGVAAATGISGADSATLSIGTDTKGTSVFVVDAVGLRDVQGTGPGMLPSGVSIEPRDDGPMPLVASGASADDIGDAAEFSVDGVDAEMVGVTRGPVPVGGREAWVMIDEAYARDVLGVDPTDRTLLVKLEEGADIAAVEAGVRDALGAAVRIDTVAEVSAQLTAGPAAQGVRVSLIAATAVAALLSALAIAMTLTLAGGARARVLALLRTLGAPRRAASSLAAWEIGPPAVAAVVAGSIFGALVPLVVMSAVDLRPFTGSTLAPAYAVDPVILAIALGGFAVVSVALTAVALLVSRRARAVGALRTVEEG